MDPEGIIIKDFSRSNVLWKTRGSGVQPFSIFNMKHESFLGTNCV